MSSNDTVKDIARPEFFKDAIQNKALSEKEGRPIFEEKEMVKITLPGDRLMNWIGEVDESHIKRWPQHYAAFKRGEERAATGTPLDQWPNSILTKARVAELKAMDILSVEELAGISDSLLPKMGMGSRELREEARAYIASATDGAANQKLAAEVARLTEMVERLSGDAKPEPVLQREKSLDECTDEELKAYIKRETGKAPAGRISRENLLKRAGELATAKAA